MHIYILRPVILSLLLSDNYFKQYSCLRNAVALGCTANSMGVLSKEGISQLNTKRPIDGMLIYIEEKQWEKRLNLNFFKEEEMKIDF